MARTAGVYYTDLVSPHSEVTVLTVVVRQRTVEAAVASAKRLAAQYGNQFAVIADPVGGDFAPFAVVAPAGWF